MVRRIDLLIFGYRKIRVDKEDSSRVATSLLHASIPSRINSDGSFSVRERDLARLKQELDGKVEYEISEPRGLYGAYLRLENKATVFSAIGVCIFLCAMSSLLVWDVRIEGNTAIPSAAIEYALSEAGLSIGDVWFNIDKNDVERNLLELEPTLSWVNVNRRAGVAYVRVAERHSSEGTQDDKRDGYANVVASCDCVIEEIRVVRGVAAVKRGDTVKAGDLLISGIISTENGTTACYAEGEVIGRMNDRVSVDVAREYETKSVKNEILIRRDVKIFDFAINIFKRYRNLNDECDIIEDVKVFSLFGKCRLPIKTVSVYALEQDTSTAVYSDPRLVSLATARLNSATLKRLVGADLLKIKTGGAFTDSGYSMYSDIEFLGEVGEASPFELE